MKKFMVGTLSAFLAMSLVACSNSASKEVSGYSIQKVKVKITDDPALIGEIGIEDSKGKMVDVKPKALYYEFKMKQQGEHKFYQNDKDEIEAKIIPNEDLKKASINTVGVNVFDEGHEQFGTGMGIEEFNYMKKGKVDVHYDLGATVKNKEMPMAPSDQKLKKLQKVARHGTLVITRNNKEIGRYDLETLEPVKK
ncbi:hypothetical protein [Priestia megaterium]|uniref:hypothetical protein n=1 Tax=Priestia megaterium TaxID=1404 RepID=UPI000D5243BD|nr:hypothetical protein [Priestia megaterium]PVE71081.1 hypothetical protein DC428_11630 [Priestia megaterium]PVE89136.1 hypothetical protein DC421_03475 [Priestia megaterium]PVE92826.1 hypothetical protein DC426_05130 [Priestia megaterium]PVE99104.1 hypothetical protein DC433_14845 [Priestia megaterium]